MLGFMCCLKDLYLSNTLCVLMHRLQPSCMARLQVLAGLAAAQ